MCNLAINKHKKCDIDFFLTHKAREEATVLGQKDFNLISVLR